MAIIDLSTSIYSGKTFLLMGLSRANFALAKVLHRAGAKVRISEAKARENFSDYDKELSSLSPQIDFEFGRHTSLFFEGVDYVVLARGISVETKPLDEVRARGTPIVSPFGLLLPHVDLPTIAVLGTEGKSSTCLLLEQILKLAKKKVFFCGDQGRPLPELFLLEERPDFFLIELNYAQAEYIKEFKPHTLAFLNTTVPAGERYNRLEDCLRALQNIARFAQPATNIIYNHKDNALRNLLVPIQANKFVFRRKDPAQVSPELVQRYRGAYLQSTREMIWLENGVKDSFGLSYAPLYGLHNLDNLMAAVTIAKSLGISKEVIQRAIDTCPGIPHRLELVKKRGGVKFINDSRAITVECLRKSLESFSLDPIILIAGGRDTQADYSVLAEQVKRRVKTLILIGESKEHINRCVGDHTETFLVGTFEEAILLSFQKSREGDIILLSPGCEGYDVLKTYEERGNYFKRYVTEL